MSNASNGSSWQSELETKYYMIKKENWRILAFCLSILGVVGITGLVQLTNYVVATAIAHLGGNEIERAKAIILQTERELLALKENWSGPTKIASHQVKVNYGDSEEFEAPAHFVGMVFVLGEGGDQMQAMHVSCDGNGTLTAPGYQASVEISGRKSDTAMHASLAKVEGKRAWKLVNLPKTTLARVVIIGASEY